MTVMYAGSDIPVLLGDGVSIRIFLRRREGYEQNATLARAERFA
jgi:hypothetical protein